MLSNYFLQIVYSGIMARAKRERVVQDGVEKANRRHGPARPGTPHSLFENWQFLTKNREIAAHSLFGNWQFSTNICEIGAHSLFENWPFSTKICEFGAHSLFENWQFSTKIGENRWNWGALLIWKRAISDENLWKLVKLRRTPYLKTGKFQRKLVKICEIEAHSFFENWQVSTKIGEN